MEIRESISLLQSVRAKMGTLGIQWVDRVEMERRAEKGAKRSAGLVLAGRSRPNYDDNGTKENGHATVLTLHRPT